MAVIVRRIAAALLITLGALTFGGAAGAQRPDMPLDTPLSADLDGDGAAETIRAKEVSCYDADGSSPPPCSRDGFRTLVIEVADACAGGEHTIVLSREMDFITLARVMDANRDGFARELAFEVRAGATGRGVQAKIVLFQPGPGGCVAVRKTVFSYPRFDTIGRRPKGTWFASGGLLIKDYARDRPGLELQVRETYARPGDAGCCPSFARTSYLSYVRTAGTYRAYRKSVRRLHR